MFERYTERARRVLFFARYELSALGGSSIEPEHLLLGLLREPKGIVEAVLAHWNISSADLSRQLKEQVAGGRRFPTSTEVPFGKATQRVLNYAAEEADRLLHSYIGVEHLFLGLLREQGSTAATLLVAHGLSLEDVRAHILKVLTEPQVEELGRWMALEKARLVGRLEGGSRRFVPDGPMRIERIMQLVDELAEAQPNSSEAGILQDRIKDELMALRTLMD
jgi:ATP-dependent Clp protease ATP-binding subunit ClpA